MLRPRQFSLAQLLAALAALQVACAAAAGAFGELVQLLTLGGVALLVAATLHLIGEGLIEVAADGLAAALDRLPLELRSPAESLRRSRPF